MAGLITKWYTRYHHLPHSWSQFVHLLSFFTTEYLNTVMGVVNRLQGKNKKQSNPFQVVIVYPWAWKRGCWSDSVCDIIRLFQCKHWVILVLLFVCVTELDNTIEQASADSQSDKEKSQRREQDLQQQMMQVMWFACLNQYITVYWLQWFCLCSLVVWLLSNSKPIKQHVWIIFDHGKYVKLLQIYLHSAK